MKVWCPGDSGPDLRREALSALVRWDYPDFPPTFPRGEMCRLVLDAVARTG